MPTLAREGLILSSGVQWLVERSHWAARAISWVAQSVPGAALAGAALPGCSMTTVPLAIPLKRQGAGDGPLLAFIITSALLGPASIVLTFTMFGPVWEFFAWPCRSLRFADSVGDCSVLEESCTRTVRTSTKHPAFQHVDAAATTRAVRPGKLVLFGPAY